MACRVPPEFAAATAHRDGVSGEQWIRALPGLIDDLAREWDCIPDGAVRHGQVGLVVPVIAPIGPAVIKISPPTAANDGEASVLTHLAGRSAVRLYRSDTERCALLLERVDGPTPTEVLSPDESIEMMGHLATRLAIPFPQASTTLAGTAAGWLEETERRAHGLPGLVTPSALQRARAAIAVVAEDRTTAVLHGDLHEGNVLAAAREPWLIIDPKGWTGTAAHDGWTVALTRYWDLMAVPDPAQLIRRRLHRFASSAQLNNDLVIEVAHARAVSSLLYEATYSDDASELGLLSSVVNTWS